MVNGVFTFCAAIRPQSIAAGMNPEVAEWCHGCMNTCKPQLYAGGSVSSADVTSGARVAHRTLLVRSYVPLLVSRPTKKPCTLCTCCCGCLYRQHSHHLHLAFLLQFLLHVRTPGPRFFSPCKQLRCAHCFALWCSHDEVQSCALCPPVAICVFRLALSFIAGVQEPLF